MKQSLQRLGYKHKQLHHGGYAVAGLRSPSVRFITSNCGKVFFTLLCLLVGQVSFAQKVISGKVTSTDGEALPGVTVLIKGTTNGTITDLDGNFRLETSAEDAVLVFSYVGFKSQEIAAGSQAVFNISMEEDVANLDEVVVVGYGTQKRSEITSAVSSISSEDFMIGRIQDASQLVKGKIPGLVITNGSGDPNATSNIMLRGITSIEGGYSPLVLVDGVVGDLNTVAPESIESISVLKDASAAAIYGTRGANGVILITTKNGKRDQPARVNYTGYVTLSDFYKTPDFMEPSDIRQYKTSFAPGDYDTDWLDAITRKGVTHKHVVTAQGGTKNTTYSGMISYKNDLGTIKRTDNDNLNVQLNLDQYFLDDKIQVGMKLWKEYHTNTANSASNTDPDVTDYTTNVYRQALIYNPTSPIYNEDGSYYENFNVYQYYNPVALLNELKGTNETETTNMIGTLQIEPIKNWKTKLLVANRLFNANYSTYTTSEYYTVHTTGYNGSAYQSYDNTKRQTLELTSEYALELEKHSLSAMLGYSYYYNLYHGFSASNSDFPTDSYLYNNLEAGSLINEGLAYMDSYRNDDKLISFFGRINYGFLDRYSLSASVRREGSSRFGADHKWGVFPAVSAAWTISNEGFMNAVSWVNNLKLRAGYGVTGRIAGESYQSLSLYNYNNSYGNYVNSDGEWVAGLEVTQNPNPDLKWETTSEINIGLDFALLRSRLFGSLDAYYKETSDLLYDYSVPLPPNLAATTYANVGSLSNKGIELMLGGEPVRTQDFSWSTTVTASRNINKLKDLSNDLYETENYRNVGGVGDPVSVTTHRIEIGKALGNFWGLKSVGVTDLGIWLIEDPETGEAIEYSTSLNTDDYRQYLGNGLPKYYMGWNNTFKYRKFDFSMQMSGQFGFKILNQQRLFYENNSIQYNRLKSAADPVYGVRPLSGSQAQAFVSYYLEKGDFLKFDNVTLGYNIDLLKDYISDLRVYFSAQNFLILTGYDGLDPELTNNDALAAGRDFRDKYPTLRSFTLGLNVTFK